MTDFVERVVPAGRPQVPASARVRLSRHAEADRSWRTRPGIHPIDRGLLTILEMRPPGWTEVRGIAAVVTEHEVEVTAAVSRMYWLGLVDVEGMTPRPPGGMSPGAVARPG